MSGKKFLYQILLFILYCKECRFYNFSNINLSNEHIPYYFNAFPDVAAICKEDQTCPYKAYVNKTACWGYEPNCKMQESYSMPSCPGEHRGWAKTKQEQFNIFYSQGDFGYVRDQMQEMMVMCEPLFKEDSSLECSKHLRFCRGRNIMIDFSDLIYRKEPFRYKMDVLKEGQIGGYCRLFKDRLDQECDHVSPLQSWGPELRYFTELEKRPIVEGQCDIVIEKPTFILKIDARFSTNSTTWLPVNSNYKDINVANQELDLRSHLNIYKQLLSLRNDEVLQLGNLTTSAPSESVFVLTRNYKNRYLFVIINVGPKEESVNLDEEYENLPNELTIEVTKGHSTYKENDRVANKAIILQPYSGLVLKTQKTFDNITETPQKLPMVGGEEKQGSSRSSINTVTVSLILSMVFFAIM